MSVNMKINPMFDPTDPECHNPPAHPTRFVVLEPTDRHIQRYIELGYRLGWAIGQNQIRREDWIPEYAYQLALNDLLHAQVESQSRGNALGQVYHDPGCVYDNLPGFYGCCETSRELYKNCRP